MSRISLELFKKHIRYDDVDADDEKLQSRLDAAEAYVINVTNRTEDELVQMGGGEVFPMPIVQVILMVAASFDEHTQAVATTQLHTNQLYAAILKKYRKLSNS